MNDLNLISEIMASICFILALKGLSNPQYARTGNWLGMSGMALSIVTTLFLLNISSLLFPISLLIAGGIIGAVVARTIPMTAVPQLVAGFHSLVGLTAILVALCAYLSPETFGAETEASTNAAHFIEMSLGITIGGITFSGSIIAFLKLQGIISGKPFRFYAQNYLSILLFLILFILITSFVMKPSFLLLLSLTLLSVIMGMILILPVGGADMPVIISMLNSYSGWASAGIGLTLNHPLLIVTGALVGASGAILSYIMCRGMNRSLLHVIFKSFDTETSAESSSVDEARPIQEANAEDAAFLLNQAKDVIIVPGYGMSVSHAQHAVFELVKALQKKDIRVRFAIHPVAGRMPGHMNVLLAEAGIPYEYVFEQSDINQDFSNTDVVLVVGANDITNPEARTNKSSPIYGMPILDVDKARTVLFLKRSLAPGYAGVPNELFYRDNTWMLFGDAKKTIESITNHLN